MAYRNRGAYLRQSEGSGRQLIGGAVPVKKRGPWVFADLRMVTSLATIPVRKMTTGMAQTLQLCKEKEDRPMRKIGSHGSAKLTTINAAAAAIDIGSKMHMAAVDPACADNPVRRFGTFTRDLHQLADWFQSCGVTTIAMESTGALLDPRLRDP